MSNPVQCGLVPAPRDGAETMADSSLDRMALVSDIALSAGSGKFGSKPALHRARQFMTLCCASRLVAALGFPAHTLWDSN